ncbi:hypothetical protein D3C85_1551840 [compost metagenome]
MEAQKFIDRIELAQAGKADVKEYLNYLPLKVAEKFEKRDDVTWDMVNAQAIETALENMTLCSLLDMEHPERKEHEKVINRCRTFLKNYTKVVLADAGL